MRNFRTPAILRNALVLPAFFLGALDQACSSKPIFAADAVAVAEDDPAPPSDALSDARKLMDDEDWENAASAFRTHWETTPKAPHAAEARFWTGYCLVQMDEYEDAINVLTPFLTALAESAWADDALLKLGDAFRATDQNDQALAAWKRLLNLYKESIWRADAYQNVIDILFHHDKNYAECLAYCGKLIEEFPDHDGIGEAHYLGAYSLNALGRYAESEAWVDAKFDPENPLEEARRHLLNIQRDLLQKKTDNGPAKITKLREDFPDLDYEMRKDLLVKTCNMLENHGLADQAKEILLEELRTVRDRSEPEIEELLDVLSDVLGESQEQAYLETLKTLGANAQTPLVVRVLARERRVNLLREDHADEAETSLREILKTDPAEYAQVHAALQLAELLADDRENPAAAKEFLKSVLTKIQRKDFQHRIRKAIEELNEDDPQLTL